MTQNDSRTPTLADYGFGSEEEFFRDPAASLAKVAAGIENKLRAEYQAHRQQEASEQQIEANWAKLFKAFPHLRHHEAEVRRYFWEWLAKQPAEVQAMQDIDAAIPLIGDAMEAHITEWKKREVEEAENALLVGGPGREDEVDPSAFVRRKSITSVLKARQNRRYAFEHGRAYSE